LTTVEFEYTAHRTTGGPCRICGSTDELTEDHVPPQSAVDIVAVEIDKVTSVFQSASALPKPPISQNGLKFFTLCGKCNSLLGRHCDPALADFAKSVARCLTSSLTLPDVLHFSLRPTAIARAVLGHLVAANTSHDRAGFDDVANDLLHDLAAPIPESLSIFYWIHPFPDVVALRGVIMPAIRGRLDAFAVFSILKFFPLGFAVTDARGYEDTDSLTPFRNLPATAVADLPVHLRRSHHANWPEAPEQDNIILMGHQGAQSVIAKPRRPPRRRRPRA